MPYVDARLSDGSRVNAIIPPLSLCGPVITIRKFTLRPFTPEDLVRLGTLTVAMMEFLGACVRAKANIVVSGGTGSGKTSLLGVLSSFIPPTERLITIEDAAELRLPQPHVVSLEARPPNVEGAGEVTVRALVRNALRMRPDRIIVGEVRGGEALDMLQAMNTGHEGSLSTAHANSPRDLLSRLETMALMSDVELPVSHVREQIAGALDLIVHTSRTSEGGRVVARISAVEGLRSGSVVLEDIFAWWRGPGPAFEATGTMPSVMKLLEERDERVDPRVFTSRTRPTGESSMGQSQPRREMAAGGRRRTRRIAETAHPSAVEWPGSIRQLGALVE
jgi:pilus assembly protein CpaF